MILANIIVMSISVVPFTTAYGSSGSTRKIISNCDLLKAKLEELSWLTLLKRRMRRDMVAILAEAFHILERNTLRFLVNSSLDN